MKIGIDCRMYGSKFTGIGIYVERLVDYLANRDDENQYVLFLSKSGMFDCTVDKPNLKKVEADVRHYSFGEQVVFPYLIAKEGLDLMHFTHFNAPLAYRGKSVVTIHDLTLSFYPGRKMKSSVHRFAYSATIRSIAKRAVEIFSVSEHTRKDLVEILDIDEDKIVTIHNGVSRERFEKAVSDEDIAKMKAKLGIEREYFLYTGVFREHKNLVRLVEAFAEIAEKHSDVDLVLAGKEDPGYRDVRDTIVRLGLSGRVRLPGFVDNDDIPALYKGASAYVFPSLYEGFGLPVIEAMAAGIPVLCSKGSSLTEVAGEGNAVFFDPLRVDDIARAMDDFLSHPGKKPALIKKGLERAKDFSWETMGAAVLAEYRKFEPSKKEVPPVESGVSEEVPKTQA
ncbi:MAG: glycosyltransferase family 1 protein [Patescibacteria group bacterium]